jgi:hypothetical protein
MDLDELSTTLGKRFSGKFVNETDSIEYEAIAERFSSQEAEILRRSIAMLPPKAPSGLSRERALAILGQLVRVLKELRRASQHSWKAGASSVAISTRPTSRRRDGDSWSWRPSMRTTRPEHDHEGC